VRITLRSAKLRSLRVTINGRAKTLKGKTLSRLRRGKVYRLPISFKGRAGGRAIVRIAGRTRGGKRVATTRRYNLCVAKKKKR
jgi:hypothetical protein